MSIQDRLEIGKGCDLETIEEAMLNVKIHCMDLFDPHNLACEIAELVSGKQDLFERTGFTEESLIDDALNALS